MLAAIDAWATTLGPTSAPEFGKPGRKPRAAELLFLRLGAVARVGAGKAFGFGTDCRMDEAALAFVIAPKLEFERSECNLGRLPGRTVGTQREERCKKFLHPFAIDRAVGPIAQLADELVTPGFGRRQRHVGNGDRLVGFPHVKNAIPALEWYQSVEELFAAIVNVGIAEASRSAVRVQSGH